MHAATATPQEPIYISEDQSGTLAERLEAEMLYGDGNGKPLSQAQVAKEIGVSPSVLNQYIGGKYQGSVEKVEDKVRLWIRARDRKREFIKGMPKAPDYTETPTSKRMMAKFGYAQIAGDITVIYGGAGVGKTTAAQMYAEVNPQVFHVTMTPASQSIASCLDRIQTAVGCKLPHHTSPAKLEGAIIDRIKGTGGLLIIDEAQHLGVKALEAIRSLHDATDIGVALLGNEKIYTTITGGTRSAEYAQLFSRMGGRLRLNKPSKKDVEALCKVAGVEDSEMIRLLYEISQRPGALRGVVKTLRLARMKATSSVLTEEHIQEAWAELGGER